MGLDMETIGLLIVGGLPLLAILFVEGILRERNTCLRCGNTSSPLILRPHFPNTGSGMNSLNATSAAISGDALPC